MLEMFLIKVSVLPKVRPKYSNPPNVEMFPRKSAVWPPSDLVLTGVTRWSGQARLLPPFNEY